MSLILLVALIVVVVLYRRRGAGRVDVGTVVRRFLEYGFLYGLVTVSYTHLTLPTILLV